MNEAVLLLCRANRDGARILDCLTANDVRPGTLESCKTMGLLAAGVCAAQEEGFRPEHIHKVINLLIKMNKKQMDS